VADTTIGIAFEESVRGLIEQRARLDNLRTRAATLLSAAAIAASFLGAEALKDTVLGSNGQAEPDRALELWELLAIASLIGVGVACLMILAPKRRGWTLRISGRSMLETYVEVPQPVDLAVMQRDLVLHIEDAQDANDAKLRRLVYWFYAGAVLLGAQVIFWFIDLTT
jgi:hypothetical protein